MDRTIAIATCLLLAAPVLASEQEPADRVTSWRCLAPPVEPCFRHRARLSSQNGIAHMMWLVGTKRIVNVTETDIPSSLSKYLDMTSPAHSDIFGEFDICPLEPDMPGHMRMVCIANGSRLVAQDRARARPAIRLLSTWPNQ
jgi:hypothetical protein